MSNTYLSQNKHNFSKKKFYSILLWFLLLDKSVIVSQMSEERKELIKGTVENPLWYRPFSMTHPFVFTPEEGVTLRTLFAGFQGLGKIEMIITDNITDQGATNVVVVFQPLFPFRFEEGGWEHKGWRIRINDWFVNYKTSPHIFSGIRCKAFSAKRVAISMELPYNVFQFGLWKASCDFPLHVQAELEDFIHCEQDARRAKYKTLKPETIALVYQTAIHDALDLWRRDALVILPITDRDTGITLRSFQYHTLHQLKNYYVSRMSWGRRDSWRLQYVCKESGK